MNSYQLVKKLNSGTYAEVWLASDEKKKKFACKLFKPTAEQKDIKTEFDFMKNHHSDYLLEANHLSVGSRSFYMKFMPRGDLFGVIKTQLLSWDVVYQWLEELALALHWMHLHHFIHRDIKTENILVDEKFQTQLGDFGFTHNLAISLPGERELGTPIAIAPELLTTNPITDWKKTDIYSFGVTCLDMINIRRFGLEFGLFCSRSTAYQLDWRSKNPDGMFDRLCTVINDSSVTIHESLKTMLKNCLSTHPAIRPSTQTILETLHAVQVVYFSELKVILLKQLEEILTKDDVLNTGSSVVALFSIAPFELKERVVNVLITRIQIPPLYPIALEMIKKIFPYVDDKKLKQKLQRLAPILTTIPEKTPEELFHIENKSHLAFPSRYQGVFFTRNFEKRHIAWVTGFPRKVSEIIENFANGPSLIFK